MDHSDLLKGLGRLAAVFLRKLAKPLECFQEESKVLTSDLVPEGIQSSPTAGLWCSRYTVCPGIFIVLLQPRALGGRHHLLGHLVIKQLKGTPDSVCEARCSLFLLISKNALS